MDLNTINKFHVFSGFCPNLLPPKEKKLFDEIGHKITFKKKAIIYQEGTNPRGAYLILKGKVKVSQMNSDGAEHILFIFKENELFGYRSLLSNSIHNLSAICLEECEIKFLDADSFLKLMDTSPVFTKQMLTRVSQELTVMINQITIYAQKGIRARLAYALLLLNEKYKLPNSSATASNIVLSRTNLAAYIGTSIDVVSRNLKFYTDRNIIKTNGKCITILDFKFLIEISGVS